MPLSANQNDPLLGRKINNAYEIVKPLASGGMSVVYLANQLSLNRNVVLKVLRPSLNDEDFINLFLREARIISQLNHPNVVGVFDFGKTPEDGIVYLAMEYLEGEDLEVIVKQKGGIALAQIMWVIEQLCNGVHAAHKLNIVHRDLKPNNVMVSRLAGDTTAIKILDFGISKPLSEEDLKHTRLGMIMFAAYESARRSVTRFYSVLTGALTPYFQTSNLLLHFGRDLALPLMPHLPYIVLQMVLTMAGLNTGWFGSLKP